MIDKLTDLADKTNILLLAKNKNKKLKTLRIFIYAYKYLIKNIYKKFKQICNAKPTDNLKNYKFKVDVLGQQWE